MKNIYSADNLAEAHMLKDFLEKQGIEVGLHEEHLNPAGVNTITLWVNDPDDEMKARQYIAEVIGDQVETKTDFKKTNHDTSMTSFFMGAVAGIILCLLGVYIYNSTFESGEVEPTSWDNNHDGKMDVWAEYSDGQLIKYLYDTNFDGEVDQWSHYQDDIIEYNEYDLNFDGKIDQKDYYKKGILHKSERDNNYNGKTDEWKYYDQGKSLRYSADNDGDGRIDEWGTFENNIMKERFWSFQNDKVADKMAVYKFGRKTSEAYDRDRNGSFDLLVLLDEFERIVETKNIDKK